MYDKAGMFRREQRRLAKPVVPALASPPDESVIPSDVRQAEVVWHGVFRGLSGYAKANREIAMRVANTVRLSIVEALEPPDYDDYGKKRAAFHKRVAVSKHAPQVRFCGPTLE